MIVRITVQMFATRATEHEGISEQVEVAIEPKFLPCLDFREIASKLAVGAFKEYLARRAEQEEAEGGRIDDLPVLPVDPFSISKLCADDKQEHGRS